VVLTNAGTASASELVAGALQDHDRAIIVGRPSFGKALIMQGMPLTDGSLMMLVVGHMKTPCGRIIQRQYRQVRTTDYYRRAGAVGDTAGRPTCQSASGRTFYGGGGVYPDIVLDEPPATPVWLATLREQGQAIKWAGARLASPQGAPDKVEAYLSDTFLDAQQLAEFRRTTKSDGIDIPPGEAADVLVRRELSAVTARAKLGEGAYYRVRLAHDPWLAAAVRAFDAASVLKGPKS
jgi:carboxyl-terminal processing protease